MLQTLTKEKLTITYSIVSITLNHCEGPPHTGAWRDDSLNSKHKTAPLWWIQSVGSSPAGK